MEMKNKTNKQNTHASHDPGFTPSHLLPHLVGKKEEKNIQVWPKRIQDIGKYIF